MVYKAWSGIEEVPYCFSRPSIKFQGNMGCKMNNLVLIWAMPNDNSNLVSWMAMKWHTQLLGAWRGSLLFLAATKQLYKWYFPSVRLSVRPSVCPSVCLSHLFDYVPIIVSSRNFQELLPMTNVRSMQKVKVRGQRSRSQRSQPNLTVSGL